MQKKEENDGVSKRIDREKNRIEKNFTKIDEKKRAVARGLMKRAAFMRVELEELEADLLEHGWTEWFSQGEQAPYKRTRPEADHYHKLNAGYQKIIKQLTDLLPKDEAKPLPDDGFDSFVGGRQDD